ncbi:circadian clock KaiB family protein [Mangrovihabitans endophyticus]|uniref:KaiB domain-containing protein n=1 Tax=Mangrovihabitans endophyticus TaxID=1751298 RepID=A0A8J3FNU6_9ACTN|nr:circadian clock KaiB family protein [Mangrovihabitans endophyticus]GGK94215.1 hypothetical protein GCM10012284_30390 [Mangrovihabitans endophyticus]
MTMNLRLYVTGGTPGSMRALRNLRAICHTHFDGQVDVEVIDVLEQPDLAEADRILATPTLLKRWPTPARRIIGDLSDPDRVLSGLDVLPLDPGGLTHGTATDDDLGNDKDSDA